MGGNYTATGFNSGADNGAVAQSNSSIAGGLASDGGIALGSGAEMTTGIKVTGGSGVTIGETGLGTKFAETIRYLTDSQNDALAKALTGATPATLPGPQNLPPTTGTTPTGDGSGPALWRQPWALPAAIVAALALAFLLWRR